MPRRKSMDRPIAALCAVLVATLVSFPAEAQWKWKDKAGHTQYSDLPPPAGVPEADILSRPAAGRRAAAAQAPSASGTAATAVASAASKPLAPRSSDPDLEAKRKQAEADQAAKAKADEARVAAARADNCSRARGQMRALDSGIRITRTNEKGEREVLDDKQRADESKHTQDVISSDCK